MSDAEVFQAAVSARRKRNRPALPYRPVSPRRLIMECRRRLYSMGIRGPRCFELVAALVELQPRVQSGVLYLGDLRMGDAMHRCSKTVHRAKYDLLRCGLVRLHCAGPGLEGAGGKILNSQGRAVSAATGYEFEPALLSRPKPARQPRKNERAISSANANESPAERRLRQQGLARMQDILGGLRARPSP